MIKAIIFDCFGVLVTEAWIPFKAKHFGQDPELLERVNDLARQANGGLISREYAIKETAKLAGLEPDDVMRAISHNIPDEALFDYIKELKPEYKIGFLSNIADDFLHQIFSPEQLSLFDEIILSYKVGFIKPQPEAFELAAERLGVEPSQCVMIDDQERNVTGAREVGMQAVLHRDTEQLKAELKLLLKN